jgi:hypothetical protein
MRTSLLILIVALGLGAFEKVEGQTAADQSPAPPVQSSSSSAAAGSDGTQPAVIVKGRSELARRISAFVNQATAFDPSDPAQGLARWQEPVCPVVSGLPQQEGDFIVGRVSEIARAAGAPLAGERCRPNLLIVASTSPEALLRAMAEPNRRSFTFGDATTHLIDEFITAPRAVRVWYHTVETLLSGRPLKSMSVPELGMLTPELNRAREALVRFSGASTNSVVRGETRGADGNPGSIACANPSHITLNVVWRIYRVFVVVDSSHLHAVSPRQLADYIALVGLAQLKPGGRLGDAPTILTLFDRGPRATSDGMSDWDRAFLKSLYATELNSGLQLKPRLQRNEIALGMLRAIAR